MSDWAAESSCRSVVAKIQGASITSSSLVAVEGKLLAYAAGSGVVVCQFDPTTSKFHNQRFFCVNASHELNVRAQSSANAYLNMIRSEGSIQGKTGATVDRHVWRDSNGFTSEPIIIGNNENSPRFDKVREIAGSPSKHRERVRSVSCVALSPDGTLLAIGESGYHPRIALFSLAPNLSSSPVALIYEHSFGIHLIAFSPTLRSFVSLGLINDGFLNVWRIASASSIELVASNKCTSVVNKVLWHGDFLVVMGLRMLKVWRVDPMAEHEKSAVNTTPLRGKNVLLGPHLTSNFTAGVSINGDEIVVMNETSHLMLLKLNYDALRLIPLKRVSGDLQSLCFDHGGARIWYHTALEQVLSIELDMLEEAGAPEPAQPTPNALVDNLLNPTTPSFALMNVNEECLLSLDRHHELNLINKKTKARTLVVASFVDNLAGFKVASLRDFLVLSKDGTIQTLTTNDQPKLLCHVDLPADGVIANSLTAVDYGHGSLVCGDIYGNIYIGAVESTKFNVEYQLKAHASKINDAIFFEQARFVYACSISRDRMVQVYSRAKAAGSRWDLLQTLATHSGNIIRVLYHRNCLHVCSADKTISIHSIDEVGDDVTITQEKVISLRNTPITIKICQDELIVSTNDRCLLIYSTTDNYELVRTLKLFDDKNESLAVENFAVHGNVIAVSSADRSLRLFHFHLGKPMSVFWGHLEPIVSLTFTEDSKGLVSMSLDGCLFEWNLKPSEVPGEESLSLGTRDTPLYTKVTRKIIRAAPAAGAATPTHSRRSSLASPVKYGAGDDSATPPSPMARLSAATLKRIESKKGEHSSPTRNYVSPLKHRASPTRHTPNPQSAKRTSWSSPSRPDHINRRLPLTDVSNVSEHADTLTPEQFVAQSIASLETIRAGVASVSLNMAQKQTLAYSMDQLCLMLGDDRDAATDALERYSEQLVNMVRRKLKLDEPKN